LALSNLVGGGQKNVERRIDYLVIRINDKILPSSPPPQPHGHRGREHYIKYFSSFLVLQMRRKHYLNDSSIVDAEIFNLLYLWDDIALTAK